MKKIALATLASLGMLSMNAYADFDAYNGFTLAYVQSTQNGTNNSSTAVTIMRSVRTHERFGYEMQFGLFGESGPFTSNGFVDLAALGLLPLSDRGLKLYGRIGLNDVYSRGSLGSANNIGLTYGAGFEYPRENGLVRVGFQHFKVGNGTLSPSLSANLFTLTLLLK
ncbi:MAG: hypothetical protein ABI479_10825 [Gallionella sp.]